MHFAGFIGLGLATDPAGSIEIAHPLMAPVIVVRGIENLVGRRPVAAQLEAVEQERQTRKSQPHEEGVGPVRTGENIGTKRLVALDNQLAGRIGA